MAYNQLDNRTYEVSAPGFAERSAHGMRKAGHALTVVPVIGALFSITVAPLLTAMAAVLESGSSVAEGHYSRGFKQAISGTVDTAVVAVGAGLTFWGANAGSTLITGSTIAEHARQFTNSMLDSADDMTGRHARAKNAQLTQMARVNQVLGAQPHTNGYATAGVGYGAGMQEQLTQAAPTNTQHADKVAQARGQLPDEARAAFNRDVTNREHVAALTSARENTQTQENTV